MKASPSDRELLIALGVLLFFLFFGRSILGFLGLEDESVAIAGGKKRSSGNSDKP